MIWCNNFIFTTCHFTKFNFLSLNINIVALCCFIISIGRIKNGNTLYRYLVINCMESNYLKQKDLFKVANIGNWLILNYHYINFGTLSTPWKDITGWGRCIFHFFCTRAIDHSCVYWKKYEQKQFIKHTSFIITGSDFQIHWNRVKLVAKWYWPLGIQLICVFIIK